MARRVADESILALRSENKMTPTLDQIINEALAVHEVLRSLGFAPEDIYVHLDDEAGVAFVVLQAQGKEFTVNLGAVACGLESFKAAWKEAVKSWNEGPESFRETVYTKSRIFADKVRFVVALLGKGIRPPKALD